MFCIYFTFRDIVFGVLLNEVGHLTIFKGDKIIISKGGDFIGKGYLSRELFVLNNVQQIINNASIQNSAYIFKSINLCYRRVCHVRIASIKTLTKI